MYRSDFRAPEATASEFASVMASSEPRDALAPPSPFDRSAILSPDVILNPARSIHFSRHAVNGRIGAVPHGPDFDVLHGGARPSLHRPGGRTRLLFISPSLQSGQRLRGGPSPHSATGVPSDVSSTHRSRGLSSSHFTSAPALRISARHRSIFFLRSRFARNPEDRIFMKRAGRMCRRNRRMNSSAFSVSLFVS